MKSWLAGWLSCRVGRCELLLLFFPSAILPHIRREQDVTVTALRPCENQINTWSLVRMWVDSEGERVKYGLFLFRPSVPADASPFEKTLGKLNSAWYGSFNTWAQCGSAMFLWWRTRSNRWQTAERHEDSLFSPGFPGFYLNGLCSNNPASNFVPTRNQKLLSFYINWGALFSPPPSTHNCFSARLEV